MANINDKAVLGHSMVFLRATNRLGYPVSDFAEICFRHGFQLAQLILFNPAKIVCRDGVFKISWNPFEMISKIAESFKEHDFLWIQRIG